MVNLDKLWTEIHDVLYEGTITGGSQMLVVENFKFMGLSKEMWQNSKITTLNYSVENQFYTAENKILL